MNSNHKQKCLTVHKGTNVADRYMTAYTAKNAQVVAILMGQD